MEIPSYTSNVQPFGSQSGIKFASENESVNSVSRPRREDRRVERSYKITEHISEQRKRTEQMSVEVEIERSREREKLNEERRAKMARHLTLR